MDVQQLIVALGGPGSVAEKLGARAETVHMWGKRNSVPPGYLIRMWWLALSHNLAWSPPGADGFTLAPVPRLVVTNSPPPDCAA